MLIYIVKDLFMHCSEADEAMFRKALAKYTGDFGSAHGAHLEKLYKNELYSIRVNGKGRVLLVKHPIEKDAFYAVKALVNHEYDKGLREHYDISELDIEVVDQHHISDAPINKVVTLSRECAYYQDRFIILNDEQQAAASYIVFPLIISGAPGSGKSCIALQMIKEYIYRNLDKAKATGKPLNIVYLVDNKILANLMNNIFDLGDFKDEDRPYINVVFKTFDEVYETTYPGRLLGESQKKHCLEYIENKIEERVKRLGVASKKQKGSSNSAVAGMKNELMYQLESIYQEFRLLSYIASNEKYKSLYLGDTLGLNDSLFYNQPEMRVWLLEIYQSYLAFLDGKINTEFFTFQCEENPDLILMDEAQDKSLLCQWSAYVQAKGNVVYLDGDHQDLVSGLNVGYHLLKMCREQTGQSPQHISLSASYRCDNPIIELANAALKLKYAISGGLSSKQELPFIEINPNNIPSHPLGWVNREGLDIRYLAGNVHYAIVYDPEFKDDILAYFGDIPSNAYTIFESKGLSLPRVYLWRPFSSDAFHRIEKDFPQDLVYEQENKKIARAKNKADVNVTHSPAVNGFYVGITRALTELTMIDSGECRNTSNYFKDATEKINAHYSSVVSNATSSHTQEESLDDITAWAKDLLQAGIVGKIEKKLTELRASKREKEAAILESMISCEVNPISLLDNEAGELPLPISVAVQQSALGRHDGKGKHKKKSTASKAVPSSSSSVSNADLNISSKENEKRIIDRLNAINRRIDFSPSPAAALNALEAELNLYPKEFGEVFKRLLLGKQTLFPNLMIFEGKRLVAWAKKNPVIRDGLTLEMLCQPWDNWFSEKLPDKSLLHSLGHWMKHHDFSVMNEIFNLFLKDNKKLLSGITFKDLSPGAITDPSLLVFFTLLSSSLGVKFLGMILKYNTHIIKELTPSILNTLILVDKVTRTAISSLVYYDESMALMDLIMDHNPDCILDLSASSLCRKGINTSESLISLLVKTEKGRQILKLMSQRCPIKSSLIQPYLSSLETGCFVMSETEKTLNRALVLSKVIESNPNNSGKILDLLDIEFHRSGEQFTVLLNQLMLINDYVMRGLLMGKRGHSKIQSWVKSNANVVHAFTKDVFSRKIYRANLIELSSLLALAKSTVIEDKLEAGLLTLLVRDNIKLALELTPVILYELYENEGSIAYWLLLSTEGAVAFMSLCRINPSLIAGLTIDVLRTGVPSPIFPGAIVPSLLSHASKSSSIVFTLNLILEYNPAVILALTEKDLGEVGLDGLRVVDGFFVFPGGRELLISIAKVNSKLALFIARELAIASRGVTTLPTHSLDALSHAITSANIEKIFNLLDAEYEANSYKFTHSLLPTVLAKNKRFVVELFLQDKYVNQLLKWVEGDSRVVNCLIPSILSQSVGNISLTSANWAPLLYFILKKIAARCVMQKETPLKRLFESHPVLFNNISPTLLSYQGEGQASPFHLLISSTSGTAFLASMLISNPHLASGIGYQTLCGTHPNFLDGVVSPLLSLANDQQGISVLKLLFENNANLMAALTIKDFLGSSLTDKHSPTVLSSLLDGAEGVTLLAILFNMNPILSLELRAHFADNTSREQVGLPHTARP